jgi:hypothetical protein
MSIRNIELLLIEEEQTPASPFQVTFVDAEGAEKKKNTRWGFVAEVTWMGQTIYDKHIIWDILGIYIYNGYTYFVYIYINIIWDILGYG